MPVAVETRLVILQIYLYVIHVTAHGSVYTLVLMSVDRYLAIVHPICSMTVRTAKNACLLLGFVWLVILLANIPLFKDFQVYKRPNTTGVNSFKHRALSVVI